MLDPINPRSAMPIYVQVTEQIRQRVAAGVLVPGDQLPSVRELASQLLINPNTAVRIYRDLEREGLLEFRRGQGTFVSERAKALAESDRLRLLAKRLEGVVEQARIFGVSDDALVDLLRETLSRSPSRAGKARS
jgi:GntR family transcriptional regulator